jgi:hypothetical protein
MVQLTEETEAPRSYDVHVVLEDQRVHGVGAQPGVDFYETVSAEIYGYTIIWSN